MAIKTTRKEESDEEEQQEPAPKKGTLNTLFSGNADSDDEKGATFEKKMKNKKYNNPDKIIKNYSEINKKMREKGEKILQNKESSKKIKKTKMMQRGSIKESDIREKMKTRRVVVSNR